MGVDETFGEMLRRLRGDRSLSAIGRLANISKGHVHDLENGRRAPSRSVAARLDEVLHANGSLIKAHGFQANARPAIPEMPCRHTLKTNALPYSEEAVTERRRLLRFAAGTALGFTESVRQVLDLTTGGHRSVDDWDIVRNDHLHALRTRPPAQVAADLAIDLHGLARHLDQAPPADLPELYRTAALLSCIQANALTRLAHHGQAIRWWRTARRTADATRDVNLRLMVRAEEAGHGLYGQRSPETVLSLIAHARRISTRPWPRMMTAEAEALAMLGRHQEAAMTLRSLVDLVEGGLQGDDLGFWMEDAIPFSQSWVYGCAGDEDAAGKAFEQVLSLAPARSYQVRTNVLLHRDVCTVERGGVDEGAWHATEVLDALPPTYRTNHIIETAKMVLHAIPREQRDRAAPRELRSILAT